VHDSVAPDATRPELAFPMWNCDFMFQVSEWETLSFVVVCLGSLFGRDRGQLLELRSIIHR
jgi:hypothetical protein